MLALNPARQGRKKQVKKKWHNSLGTYHYIRSLYINSKLGWHPKITAATLITKMVGLSPPICKAGNLLTGHKVTLMKLIIMRHKSPTDTLRTNCSIRMGIESRDAMTALDRGPFTREYALQLCRKINACKIVKRATCGGKSVMYNNLNVT